MYYSESIIRNGITMTLISLIYTWTSFIWYCFSSVRSKDFSKGCMFLSCCQHKSRKKETCNLLIKECLLAEEVFSQIFNGLSSILDSVDSVTPLAFAAAFAFFLWRTDSFFVALDFAGCFAGSSGRINQTPANTIWVQ